MNKETFIKQLNTELKMLSKVERRDIIVDYEEYFLAGMEEGKTEEVIAAGLGSPSQIAKELLASHHIDKVEKTASAGNILRAMWAVIGLGFFNLVIVLGPFIALVSVLISGWVVALTFVLSPLAVLYNIAFGSFIFFELFFTLALCGIGIFAGMGMNVATKAFSKGFIRYLKYNAALVKGGLRNE